ncbi:MAG: hypothetical protein ACI9KE_004937 [Polyangiales bacterium]|jgi:hypothetical protein
MQEEWKYPQIRSWMMKATTNGISVHKGYNTSSALCVFLAAQYGKLLALVPGE